MRTIRACFKILLLSAVGALLAQAQATRTWVSGVGDDANPCSRTAPCATFAGAFSVTAVGGEIDSLDPGDFGPLVITNAITIDGGDAQAFVGVAASGDGIVVNAGSGRVTLRNLRINGFGVGTNGIKFLGGGPLHIENCATANFTNLGIDIEATGGEEISILGTVSSDNGASGLSVSSTSAKAFVIVDKSHFENNTNGVLAVSFSRLVVRDGEASGNANSGFVVQASAGDAILSIVNSSASNNLTTGVQAGGSSNLSILRLSGASIFSNAVNGLLLSSNGSIVSLANNHNSGNGAPTSAAFLQ